MHWLAKIKASMSKSATNRKKSTPTSPSRPSLAESATSFAKSLSRRDLSVGKTNSAATANPDCKPPAKSLPIESAPSSSPRPTLTESATALAKSLSRRHVSLDKSKSEASKKSDPKPTAKTILPLDDKLDQVLSMGPDGTRPPRGGGRRASLLKTASSTRMFHKMFGWRDQEATGKTEDCLTDLTTYSNASSNSNTPSLSSSDHTPVVPRASLQRRKSCNELRKVGLVQASTGLQVTRPPPSFVKGDSSHVFGGMAMPPLPPRRSASAIERLMPENNLEESPFLPANMTAQRRLTSPGTFPTDKASEGTVSAASTTSAAEARSLASAALARMEVKAPSEVKSSLLPGKKEAADAGCDKAFDLECQESVSEKSGTTSGVPGMPPVPSSNTRSPSRDWKKEQTASDEKKDDQSDDWAGMELPLDLPSSPVASLPSTNVAVDDGRYSRASSSRAVAMARAYSFSRLRNPPSSSPPPSALKARPSEDGQELAAAAADDDYDRKPPAKVGAVGDKKPSVKTVNPEPLRLSILPPSQLRSTDPIPAAGLIVDGASSPHNVYMAPGLSAPLRDTKETLTYIAEDRLVTTGCYSCQAVLYCMEDAEFMLCPVCRVCQPVGGPEGGGIGMGMTAEDYQDCKVQQASTVMARTPSRRTLTVE